MENPIEANKVQGVYPVNGGTIVKFDLIDKTLPDEFFLPGVANWRMYTVLPPYELAVKISRVNPKVRPVILYLEKTHIRDTSYWHFVRNGGSLV